MSRWFVGSSRIRKFDSESMSFARETRPRSPPERSLIRLNTSSPVNKNAASVLRISVLFRDGYSSEISSNSVFIGMQDVMLLIVADLHLTAESDGSGVRFHQLVDKF